MRLLETLYFVALCCAHTQMQAASQPITNFIIYDQGVTWQALSWDVGDFSPNTLDKFSLLVDNDLTTQFRCFDPTCYHNETFLQSCTDHTYELTGHYLKEDGHEVLTDPVTTAGTTEGGVPSAVQGLAASGPTISWTPPAEGESCISYYQVCETSSDGTTCYTVTDTTFEVTGGACDTYTVEVSAVSTGGDVGPPTSAAVTLPEAQPGPVQNMLITDVTNTTITVEWDAPIVNKKCVHRYAVVVGLTDVVMVEKVSANPHYKFVKADGDREFMSTDTNLKPCTDYTVDVFAVTVTNAAGVITEQDTSTADGEPMPLTDVTVTSTNESITINWGVDGEDNCISSVQVCYIDTVQLQQVCDETDGGGGAGGNGGHFEIDGLLACSSYEIYLTGISTGGTSGTPMFIEVSTDDVAPGPVQNLTVDNVSPTSVTFSYDDPLENPQCVSGYDTTEINHNRTTQGFENPSTYIDHTDTRTGLDACCYYTLEIRGSSPTGLKGPWSTIDFSTPEATPSAPQSLQLMEATSDSLQITWFQPALNKYCAQHYTISYSGPDGIIISNTIDINSPLPTEMFYLISGLLPSTDYTVNVNAVTPLGVTGPFVQGVYTTAAA